MIVTTTPGGGSCLFNAVAMGLIFHETKQWPSLSSTVKLGKLLRKLVTQSLRRDFEVYKNLMALQFAEDKRRHVTENTVDKYARMYIQEMSKSCTWGGQLEIKILSDLIQSFGFKGIVIFRRSPRGLTKIRGGFSPNLNNHKNHPPVYIHLSDVDSGGSHFSFIPPPPTMKVTKKPFKMASVLSF